MDTVKTTAMAREAAFASAREALSRAREKQMHARPHRAISRLAMGPALLLQSLVLMLGFCGALVVFKPQLLELWRHIILFWAGLLDMPLQAAAAQDGASSLGLEWTRLASADMPGSTTLALTAAVTLIAFAATFAMNGRALPLKYLVRILCVVQALSLLFFWLAPAQYPYSVDSHVRDLAMVGYVIMVAVPVMLALGYYVLNIGVAAKVTHTALILLYFMVLIPHQVVAHVLILQNFSLLFMPILYICFGALFNMLMFVALYSWAASTTSQQATT